MNSCLGETANGIVISNKDKYRETLADICGINERKTPPLDDIFLSKIDRSSRANLWVSSISVSYETWDIDLKLKKVI